MNGESTDLDKADTDIDTHAQPRVSRFVDSRRWASFSSYR
jgi:hypothetical protein